MRASGWVRAVARLRIGRRAWLLLAACAPWLLGGCFGGGAAPAATPVPTPILMTVSSPTAQAVAVREATVLVTVVRTVVHTVVVTAVPAAPPPPPPAASPTTTPLVATPGAVQLVAPPLADGERRVGAPQRFASADGGVRVAVTVNAVADPPNSAANLRPPAGRWVMLDWTVRNEGDRPFRLNPLDAKLQTADGYLLRADPGAGQREPLLLDDTLGPGQAVRGVLAYDVPTGQALRAAVFQPPFNPQLLVADLAR